MKIFNLHILTDKKLKAQVNEAVDIQKDIDAKVLKTREDFNNALINNFLHENHALKDKLGYE